MLFTSTHDQIFSLNTPENSRVGPVQGQVVCEHACKQNTCVS